MGRPVTTTRQRAAGPQHTGPVLIVKPDPDVDCYVGWSTVVGAPLHAGTRVETEAVLAGQAAAGYVRPLAGHSPGERLWRADVAGSSVLPDAGGLLFGWPCVRFVVRRHPGVAGSVSVARSDLAAYAALVVGGRAVEALALTLPVSVSG